MLGIVLGIALANALTGAFGSTFAVNTGFGVDARVLLVSALVGLLAPPLAALPAIRRAVRLPLREALQATGSAVGGQDAGDRLLRRVRFLPRTAQIGLRNVGRRRRRSLSTALVIAFAVGTLLAVLGLAAGIGDTSRASWGDHGEDVRISSEGRRPLDAQAARLISATPGVARIEPTFVTDVKLAGKDALIWAVRQATMFHYRISAGRWYTPSEERTRARVAVVEADIARTTGTQLGDQVEVQTASGPVSLRVIGISANQQENGTALYVPLTTMHALLPGVPADANDYWVRTTSPRPHADRPHHNPHRRHADEARLRRQQRDQVRRARQRDRQVPGADDHDRPARVPGRRDQHGRPRERADDERARTHPRDRHPALDRRPRPRHPPHLRHRDARPRPHGLADRDPARLPPGPLPRVAGQAGRQRRDPVRLPAWYLAPALAGTILLALLITLLPIRRAVRYRPGDALRYA